MRFGRGTIRGVSVLFLFCGVVVLALAYLAATWQGVDYKCFVDGPHPAAAVISERADIVQGGFSWWPLGRTCEWERADGAGTVVGRQDDYPGSILAYGLLAVGAAGAVTPLPRPRPRGARAA